MGAQDSVTATLAKAKETLANASNLTKSVEGNPTSSFAPKKEEPPKPPQAKKPQDASYSIAKQARSTAEGLKARRENVDQYVNATKQ
jgi:hypothetical protein